MTATEYTRYLHAHIPLTAAMQLRVLEVAADVLRIAAPLDPNRNHHGTVFGGSLATLGIVAGWALVDRWLAAAGVPARLVVQRQEADFLAPATGEVHAEARWADADPAAFLAQLQQRGRARVEVVTELRSAGLLVQRGRARYVALGDDPA